MFLTKTENMDVPQFLFFLFLNFCVKTIHSLSCWIQNANMTNPHIWVHPNDLIYTHMGGFGFHPNLFSSCCWLNPFLSGKTNPGSWYFFNGPHIVWRYQIPHTCTMSAWFIPMLYLNPFPIGIPFAWPGRDDKQLHGASTLGHPSRSVAAAPGVYDCGEICM